MVTAPERKGMPGAQYFSEHEHPVWWQAFDAESRRKLMEEDLLAGRSVSAVLIAIVSLGLLIGIVSVICVL